MPYVFGRDIAKASFHAALLNQDTHKMSYAVFDNNASGFERLNHWLLKQGVSLPISVCMEATGRYYDAVATYLHQRGHRVSVVNPSRIAHYAKSKLLRNKTDKLDAACIAEFAATQQPDVWTPPSLLQKQLQALTHQLDALKKMRTQESNRLNANPPCEQVKHLLKSHLDFLDDQIAQLNKQLDELTNHQEFARPKALLLSIIGIGELTAYRLLAENITRFNSHRKLAAYAGLSPRHHESGQSVNKPQSLCKLGNSHLRNALYFPAITAMRANPALAEFARRLKAKGKPNKLIIAAVMRKLLCLAFAILKADKPFQPDYVTGG